MDLMKKDFIEITEKDRALQLQKKFGPVRGAQSTYWSKILTLKVLNCFPYY